MKYPDDHPFSPNYRSRLVAELAKDASKGKANKPKAASQAGKSATASALSKASRTRSVADGATPGQRAGVNHLARSRKARKVSA